MSLASTWSAQVGNLHRRRRTDQGVFMHKGKTWEAGPAAQLFEPPATIEFAQSVATGLELAK